MDEWLIFLFGGYSSNCGHFCFKKEYFPCAGSRCFSFVGGTSVNKSLEFPSYSSLILTPSWGLFCYKLVIVSCSPPSGTTTSLSVWLSCGSCVAAIKTWPQYTKLVWVMYSKFHKRMHRSMYPNFKKHKFKVKIQILLVVSTRFFEVEL
jgi:hypothetical protein